MATSAMRRKKSGNLSYDKSSREGSKSLMPERCYSWEPPAAIEVWNHDEERPSSASWPQEYLCPISGEPMATPVVLEQNGLRFDLTSVIEWVGKGNTTCPVTGEVLKSPIRLPLDVQLQAEIQGFGAVHDLPLHHPDVSSAQQRRMAKAFERRSSLDVDQLLGLLCLG